jgi:uncharacterized RDD family membrane protein YckC
MSTQELEPPTGLCAVTGKIVPEDELVTIQGQRVCAEGKAILLERLKTGEAMPGEFMRPTVMRRFGCIFLDGLIIVVPFSILSGILATPRKDTFLAGLVSIISTAVALIYYGQMHGTKGATIGKMAGKTRVVNLDGSPIDLKTGYVRAIAYVGPTFLTGIAAISAQAMVVNVAAIIVGVWGLADTLFALFDRIQQRSLHDRVAGTRVIQVV